MRWGFLLGGVLILATPAHAAFVLSVGDGDTITVTEGSGRIKVRLACIDAPETSQSPYGMEARRALQGLLPIGSQVTLRTKATDRYGRSVAEVLKGSNIINQSLVRSGDAFVYWQYISGCDRQTYSRLENDARLKSAGVWSVPEASNAHGTTGTTGVVEAAAPPAAVDPLPDGIDAERSDPGTKHRHYSSRGTPTLTVMATARHVSLYDRK